MHDSLKIFENLLALSFWDMTSVLNFFSIVFLTIQQFLVLCQTFSVLAIKTNAHCQLCIVCQNIILINYENVYFAKKKKIKNVKSHEINMLNNC